ncbi:hypothetical protein [Myxococcus xanthus]|uniref:hypothetical protein n=1 Tax=Myxococcus xanthus TaxID=34 RepID=UPI00116432D1|nr:hypothetical protein [Myxococcus xanthus]QDF03297.1 hypothetical protein BHS04_08740 [Myxococcus xanthus]
MKAVPPEPPIAVALVAAPMMVPESERAQRIPSASSQAPALPWMPTATSSAAHVSNWAVLLSTHFVPVESRR